MKQKIKKGLSLCLGLSLSAMALPISGIMPRTDDVKVVEDSAKDETATLSALSADMVGEGVQRFAAMTLDGDRLSVNGKNVGAGFGGVLLSEDGDVVITDNGVDYTLEQAKELLGVSVMVNGMGKTVITAPFQTARLIVRTSAEFADAAAQSVEMPFENTYLVTYSSQAEAYKAFKRLSDTNGIDFVEPDAINQIAEMGANGFDDFDFSDYEEDPNEELVFDGDALDIDSWGRNIIGAPGYCKQLKADNEELPIVKVAVVDTGIYFEHNRFKNRILDGAVSFADTEPTYVDDMNGHGTHCAGIVCSSTNDNVKILPVKVIDRSGFGTTSAIYAGIMYAIDQGVDVISISIGGSYKSHLFDEAVERAEKMGITVCVAAGNEAVDTYECYGCLSSIDSAVVVASIDSEKNPSYFSNFGESVDFAAPGEEINSASTKHPNATIRHSGTSMATPFVAAVFADFLSYNETYTADELYSLVKANAVDICDPGFDRYSGWGMVNLNNVRFDAVYVDTPYSDLESGKYNGSQTVRLLCRDKNADIYYTLDGSKPTVDNGIKYDKPIKVDSSCCIRAVAVINGAVGSEAYMYYEIDGVESTAAYSIDDGVLSKYSGFASDLDIAAMTKKGELPEITSIGDNAFRGNTNIERVVLPDSVKRIGMGAFRECTNLKSVTTKAEELGESVFRGCKELREFKDGNLKSVGFAVFFDCVSLRDICENNLTALNDYTFCGCVHITEDNFDLSKITRFGKYCLSETGLSGDIDVSAGLYFDMGALSKTAITSVKFSPKLAVLREELLKDCVNIRNISAPGVTKICDFALALGKTGFIPENVVTTDIDFTKVTNVGFNAFAGYVFDGPVSFDSLDSSTYLNAFADAYGEWLSLPTLIDLESIVWDWATDESYSNDFKVNVLDVHNALRADTIIIENFIGIYYAIGEANIVYVSDDFYAYGSEDPSEGYDVYAHFYTQNENEYLRKRFGKSKFSGYSTGNILFEKNDWSHYYYVNDPITLQIYSLYEGYTPSWLYKGYLCDHEDGCAVNDETLEAAIAALDNEPEILDVDGKFDLQLNIDKRGYYLYCYRLTNDETGEYIDNDLIIETNNIDSNEVKANENLNRLNMRYYTNCRDADIEDIYFTCEKTGEYRLEFSHCDAEINLGSETLAVFKTGYYKPPVFTFEEGNTYRIRVKRYWTGNDNSLIPLYDGDVSFAILTPDFTLTDIHDIDEFSISFDGYEHMWDYDPEIILRDGDKLLENDVDYICDWYESDGNFEYAIYGIGKYCGKITHEDSEAERYETVTVGTTYLMNPGQSVLFYPEEDGIYKFAYAPSDEELNEAMDFTFCGPYQKYMGGFEFYRYDTEKEEFVGIDVDTSSDKVTEALSNFNDMNNFELKAGECYKITNKFWGTKMTITTGETLSECSFDIKRSYEYNNEPVKPEITITNKNGETLVEGIDYNVTVWKNEKPGIMFAYIEGTENYPGSRPVLMVIDGGGVEYREYNGESCVAIVNDKPFNAYWGLKYLIEADEPCVVKADTKYGSMPGFGIECVDGPFYYPEYTGLKKYGLNKGTYVINFDGFEEDTEVTFGVTDDKNVLSAENIFVSDAPYTGRNSAPEVKVVYDGVEVPEDEYTIELPDEYSDPGVYYITIDANKRAGKYFGRVRTEFVVRGEEKKELSDGMNDITIKRWVVDEYDWVPENEDYSIFPSGYNIINMTIADENGNTVFNDEVSNRLPAEITVESGKKYSVFVSGKFAEDMQLDIVSECLLRNCTASYDKLIPYSADMEIPEVTFTDGDYVLEYGKDYTIIDSSFIHSCGLQEFIYEGMGKYKGTAVVPCTIYKERFDFDEPITTMYLNSWIPLGAIEDIPAFDKYIRVTSELEGTVEYSMDIKRDLYDKSVYSTLAEYDENGEFIGICDNSHRFTLEKGETHYFVFSVCHYADDMDHYYDTAGYVFLSLADDAEPETTTAPPTTTTTTETTATTTETTTTETATETTTEAETETTTTDAPITTEATTTTATTTAADDNGTTTVTTASEQAATTTTTAPIEGELPETGYSSVYGIIAVISGIMTLVGAAAVTASKQRKEEN